MRTQVKVQRENITAEAGEAYQQTHHAYKVARARSGHWTVVARRRVTVVLSKLARRLKRTRMLLC